MAQKKTSSSSQSKSTPRASTGKQEPVSPEGAWTGLEQQVLAAMGPKAVGQYPSDLEPMSLVFEQVPDETGLLPESYQRFVEALGYRWLNTGKKALAFLPPRWRASASQGMGEPNRQWTDVRAEREAGRHVYRFVMFASADLNDVNGFAFGRGAGDDAPVVFQVEDSLPLRELGSFEAWLGKALEPLRKAVAKPAGAGKKPELGDPLALLQESLGEAAAKARQAGAAALLDTFPRDTRAIALLHRKLGVVPDMVAEFTELKTLTLKGAGLKELPAVLGRLSKLEQLDCSWNAELATLPSELGQLQHLESLNLDHTAVATLPEVLGQLSRLRSLSLKNTRITALPAWLSRLATLEFLDLSQTDVPPGELEAFRKARPECSMYPRP
ncbi:leucine-rich repeat domain-containing protein [Myxococcus sp. K38C18041901]|uniref:leucine-rich repeat domain-containing protein n=1 Tax=Myxococcus guangdongensis TaxID=2906760 RepID=UPI0020A79730|nr:leucine-rich repeat domain-containing protein [Myxococcus guangdongensis]MCP3065120.1 leucine-rich repeat domain-containing protein [Myxococcus guangdongensis]